MTGPEHYKKAEQLIGMSQFPASAPDGWRDRDMLIVLAQVHATLALAAATAVVADDEGEWREAVSGGAS